MIGAWPSGRQACVETRHALSLPAAATEKMFKKTGSVFRLRKPHFQPYVLLFQSNVNDFPVGSPPTFAVRRAKLAECGRTFAVGKAKPAESGLTFAVKKGEPGGCVRGCLFQGFN